MAREMTPQERAAELCFKLALLVDAGTHTEVDTDAMKAIADALIATRRAALLGAVEVVRGEMWDDYAKARLVVIAKELTRLAQEGA